MPIFLKKGTSLRRGFLMEKNKMLRSYQSDLYNRSRQALLSCRGVCIVAPCRSGKSYIVLEIVRHAMIKKSSVLILAHRNILLDQHRRLITECFRLMGVSDDKSQRLISSFSDSVLYHLAGDSIVTTCLMAIFSQCLDIDWVAKAKEAKLVSHK